MKLRILIAGLMFGVAALADDSGAELFQKAVTQEQAAGNLEEAIKLYQRVVTEFPSDRLLVAKALMRQAQCYEKLGQGKAVKLYEQVARDFRDQRELAATASARLAVLKQREHPAPTVPPSMTQRKIDLPYPNYSYEAIYQTDGQRAIYKDLATGALMISDLAGKDKRVILKPKGSISEHVVPSRDFSIVLVRLVKPDGSQTNAVIKTDGTGYREIGGETHCGLGSWSWDNRSILVCDGRGETRQLLKISIADGQIRKIADMKRFDWAYRFSPDGRFIVYGSDNRIFIISSQGGEPQLLLDGWVEDWTRDGRYLIFDCYPRDGAVEALYLLPIKDGQRAGDPVFIRYGSFEEGRTTGAGALVYRVVPPGGMFTSWLGTLQPANGSLSWTRLGVNDEHYQPAWSPDGSEIAYVTTNHAEGQNQNAIIRVRKLASGEERELYRGFLGECFWSSVQPSLFCLQWPQPPALNSEVVSISIDSGRAERLGPVPSMDPLFGSSDGKAIYGSTNAGIVRWEIGAQQQTVLGEAIAASPDERWIGRWKKEAIEIRPMSGGDWRTLVSLPENISPFAFTSDGNWVVYQDIDEGVESGLLRVATSGGQPERLGDFPTVHGWGTPYISPDGQKIILRTSNPVELWLLENFEPPAPKR